MKKYIIFTLLLACSINISAKEIKLGMGILHKSISSNYDANFNNKRVAKYTYSTYTPSYDVLQIIMDIKYVTSVTISNKRHSFLSTLGIYIEKAKNAQKTSKIFSNEKIPGSSFQTDVRWDNYIPKKFEITPTTISFFIHSIDEETHNLYISIPPTESTYDSNITYNFGLLEISLEDAILLYDSILDNS